MAEALRAGHKIFFLGNGGSAADAQHLTAELTGRYLRERPAGRNSSQRKRVIVNCDWKRLLV